MKRKEKPKMNSPMDLRLLFPEKMSGRAMAKRGRAKAAISTLNPKIEMIQAVTVVPDVGTHNNADGFGKCK